MTFFLIFDFGPVLFLFIKGMMGRLEAICHFLRLFVPRYLVGVLFVIPGGIIHLLGFWPVYVSEVLCCFAWVVFLFILDSFHWEGVFAGI